MATLRDRLYDAAPAFVQDLMVSEYGRRIRKERFGPAYDRLTELFERSERWSREEMRAYQDERLAGVVAHAYETVPFYRERLDALRLRPSDVRRVDDLPKLPILEREDVVRNAARMVTTAVPGRRLWTAVTSGTTGAALSVRWDASVVTAANACLWRSRRWAGVAFGRPYATLFGRMVVPGKVKRPPYWRVNRSWNQLLLSPLHLNDDTAPLYLDAMRRFGAEALETYPSSGYVLAGHAAVSGRSLALRAVFTTSEPLLPEQRRAIGERFGCPVFDFYSQAERVGFSSECETHAGHHLYDEYGVTELVDGSGVPVAAGSPGRVIATGLWNRGMPLIRYATGDVTSLDGRPCPCGRTLPLMTGVATKEEDIVVTADGRMISPSLLSAAFKYAGPVAKSQIVQRERGELTVRIVKRDGYTGDDAGRLEHALKERLGDDLRVRFEYVADIPPAAGGKYRWVISTVPLRWGSTSVRRDERGCR